MKHRVLCLIAAAFAAVLGSVEAFADTRPPPPPPPCEGCSCGNCPPPPPTPEPQPQVTPAAPTVSDNEFGRIHLRFQGLDTFESRSLRPSVDLAGVCRQYDRRKRWNCERKQVEKGNRNAFLMADIDQVCRHGTMTERWRCLRRIDFRYPRRDGCTRSATPWGSSTEFRWDVCADLSVGTPLGPHKVANKATVVGRGKNARVVLAADARQYWLRQWTRPGDRK